MNEQELNKKLALWVGISVDEFIMYPADFNFTQSLDACFKWLVPKLNQLGWGVNLMQAMNNSYWKCVLWEWGNPFTTPLDHKREDADTPALALCKAIEKFIDELP